MRSRFSTPAVVTHMLSDSVRSFNAIHDSVGRCETGELRNETCLADELAAKAGLDIRSPGFPSKSYSLDPVMGMRKFRPHHISYLSEQHSDHYLLRVEVKFIDTRQISEVQGFGCEVEFNPATESEP